jgi:REP element-mobilizing transposase RayT
MRDHLHVLAEGQESDSDLISFANLLKQRTSFAHCRRRGDGHLWQKGYFEHVLRDDEMTRTVAKYILENPVRAGLVQEPLDYPFSGSLVYDRRQWIDLWHGGTP